MSAEVKSEAAPQPTENLADRNFANLRKKTEMLEQEISKRDAMLQQQQETINQIQQRFAPQERDEMDSIADDELLDKSKFKRLLEKERTKILKDVENVAVQAYQKYEQGNFQSRLANAYPDYENVVTQENAEKLQEKDPEFYAALSEIKDDYKRREFAYKKMKKIAEESKPKVKAQDVVDENRKTQGNYFAPQGQSPSANPYGFEFDVKSPDARKAAYARLKNAQKKGF